MYARFFGLSAGNRSGLAAGMTIDQLLTQIVKLPDSYQKILDYFFDAALAKVVIANRAVGHKTVFNELDQGQMVSRVRPITDDDMFDVVERIKPHLMMTERGRQAYARVCAQYCNIDTLENKVNLLKVSAKEVEREIEERKESKFTVPRPVVLLGASAPVCRHSKIRKLKNGQYLCSDCDELFDQDLFDSTLGFPGEGPVHFKRRAFQAWITEAVLSNIAFFKTRKRLLAKLKSIVSKDVDEKRFSMENDDFSTIMTTCSSRNEQLTDSARLNWTTTLTEIADALSEEEEPDAGEGDGLPAVAAHEGDA
jgi:hypothetical protein